MFELLKMIPVDHMATIATNIDMVDDIGSGQRTHAPNHASLKQPSFPLEPSHSMHGFNRAPQHHPHLHLRYG